MHVLECLRKARVYLNKDKHSFSVGEVIILGHTFDQAGVHPDQKKVKTIQLMTSPRSLGHILRCQKISWHDHSTRKIYTYVTWQ